MFERFTDRARRVLMLAQEEARLLTHPFIGTEHILLGLVHEGEGLAAKALEELGVTLTAARRQVEEIVGTRGGAPAESPPFTPRAKKVLELSLREALNLGHSYIGTEHILLGLVREGEGVATQALIALDVPPPRVREKVVQLMAGTPGESVESGGKRRKVPRRAGYEPSVPLELAATADACALCGRDLWEVAHFFGAGDVRVCDECILAAGTILGSAADEPRELILPPRVFGDVPDAGSVDDLVGLVHAVVGPPAGRLEREAAVGDPSGLERHLRALEDRLTGGSRVSRIKFIAPDTAQLRFHFHIVGSDGEITAEGPARRVDGRWVLTRAVMMDVLERAGVRPPADG